MGVDDTGIAVPDDLPAPALVKLFAVWLLWGLAIGLAMTAWTCRLERDRGVALPRELSSEARTLHGERSVPAEIQARQHR